MKYERLTRTVKFEFNGQEYGIILDLGSLEEVELALPRGVTLVSMFMQKIPPTIPLLKKAFCVGLIKDGKKVGMPEALNLYRAYCEEMGMQHVFNLFYASVAASGFLGKAASDEILGLMGLDSKDDVPEQAAEEKNA